MDGLSRRSLSGEDTAKPANLPPLQPERRPSLLPAFEPLSSSPGGLPRPQKRKFDSTIGDDRKYYPTPIPTSSTGILPSSPGQQARQTRPGMNRTVSTLSERNPLGDVPTLTIPANGEPLLMGRSSTSSDHQLAANRHISRVHVRASYYAVDASYPNGKVEIECLGWNGAKVSCREEVVDLRKGDCWTTEHPGQIMIDVHDTRVMLAWPKEDSAGAESDSWEQESPSKRRAVESEGLASSPPMMAPHRFDSPTSPSPVRPVLNPNDTFSSTFRADTPDDGEVQVYQDPSSDEDAPHGKEQAPVSATRTPSKHFTPCANLLNPSQASFASEQEELSEHDEENDPVVHSFGPYGENILSRFESFRSAASPERKRKPLQSSFNSPTRKVTPAAPVVHASPVKNHVINQLAFSRAHSLPLSTIHSNLPAELRGAMAKSSDAENRNILSSSDLKTILDGISCVGEISRKGKDAAGKLLESEYYYVPEQDEDENRRDTVTQSLGKTGLRAARKQHKVSTFPHCSVKTVYSCSRPQQYYWKKPRV